MLWAILALLGAILDAGYYALVKRSLASLEDEVLAAGVFLSTSALLLLVSFVRGIPVVSPALLPPVLVTGTINILSALLVFHALRRIDLSLAVPIITFTLVFLMGSSFLVLGEVPTATGIAGILLIVLGAFVMNAPAVRSALDQQPGTATGGEGPAGASGDERSPGREEARPARTGRPDASPVAAGLRALAACAGRLRGILVMLLVAFLYSLSLPFDKAVVLASDAVFGSACVCLFIGGVLGGVALARGTWRRAVPSAVLAAAVSIGLVLAGETIAINLAYTLQIVPYVIAVKRLSILFSVLIGGIAFREGGLRFRVPGALVMLGGVALIVLTTGP